MPIDPCREWLGIDAVDLASPHLVLGVRENEPDSQAIERAAGVRLRTLEAISPGPFERAHAALVSRIHEARDELLESARRAAAQPPRGGLASPPPPLSSSGAPAWPGAVTEPPPLAPPPVPLASAAWVPAAADVTAEPSAPGDAAGSAPAASGGGDVGEPAIVVGRRRRGPRRSADSGWIVATIASLVAVAACLVAFVVISGQERVRRVAARGPERPRLVGKAPATPARRPDPIRRPPTVRETPREDSATPPDEKPAPKESTPEVPAMKDPTPDEPAPKDPTPDEAAPKDPAPDEPAPKDPAPDEPAPKDPPPDEPTADPAADPAAVEKALKKAFAEMRAGRFAAADKAVDEAAAAAADDLTAERVERWRLLVTYARQLAEYRDTALSEATKKGGDYEVDGRTISVIEMNQTQFVYKELGDMKRPRKDAIPPRIVFAILSTWFAADGRPANDIYVGIQHLVGGEPDLDAARAAWRRAGQGGEEVAPLMGLLADPVLRGGGP